MNKTIYTTEDCDTVTLEDNKILILANNYNSVTLTKQDLQVCLKLLNNRATSISFIDIDIGLLNKAQELLHIHENREQLILPSEWTDAQITQHLKDIVDKYKHVDKT